MSQNFMKKLKKKSEPSVKLNVIEISNIVDLTKEIREEFLKAGFASEQAFELTLLLLKKYLG